jgi:hypothetical protein
MQALEDNAEALLALTNGPATGSKREHSASDDEDEKADVQEKAAQQKRGRLSVSSRPVLESGTSKAKQLGVLVKQKNIWFVQLSDCLVVTSLYSPLSLSLSLFGQ